MKTVIYHNPMCSKSREALNLLKQGTDEIEVIEYLKEKPSVAQLQELVTLLGVNPEVLVRKSEVIYKDLFKGQALSDAQWIQAMADHPQLIERPIIIRGNRAVIGRPVERVIELLK